MKNHYKNAKAKVVDKFREIITLEGSPNSLALGAGAGVFLAFMPFFGLEWLILLTIIFLVKERVNKITLVLGLLVRNPFTTIPLTFFTYAVGRLFIPGPTSINISNLSSLPTLFAEIAYPLLLGSLISGIAGGFLIYALVYYFVTLNRGKE